MAQAFQQATGSHLVMEQVASSFIALRDGSNRPSDYNTLAAAFNLGIIRAESIHQAGVEVFRAAQHALLRADGVYESLKVYAFPPADMMDLARGVQAYSEVLQESTDAQMTAAAREGDRRLARGMHARVPGMAH